MTDQEKKFADEYVFHYFNSEERGSWSIAIEAARFAGYTLPESKPKAEEVVKALYNKDEVKEYIEGQILAFKEKLNPSQRRNLWTAIAAMTVGDPGEWNHHGLIKSNI
jgi:phage terminase small subunit